MPPKTYLMLRSARRARLEARTASLHFSPFCFLEFEGAGQPYLSKPFPVEAFLQRVNELVGPR